MPEADAIPVISYQGAEL